MVRILNKLKKMDKCEVLDLLKREGSCFVTPISQDEMFIEHLFVNDSDIKSLELSPNKQFKEISPDVWYISYKSPKAKNLCYWLYKNCQNLQNEEFDEKERIKRMIPDKYSKNIFTFYNEDDSISSSRAYMFPFKVTEKNRNITEYKLSFYSENLKEERECMIVLPPDYDSKKRYPCLFISDGTPWRKSLHLESLLYKKMEEKTIKPQIMCFIIQKDRNIELPMNKSFSAYVAEELVCYLYEKGLVLQGADNYTFFGSSYGGLAGQYIQMYYGDKIGKIICQSSSLWYDKEDEILNYYQNKNFVGRLYYSYGNCEAPFITDKGQQFEDILTKREDCRFVIFEGGHEYFAWQDDLINALKYFDK